MTKIETSYVVNQDTLALLPAKQIDYDTIVLETNKQIYVRQTSITLIKKACIKAWSDYRGRRRAAIHHTNYKQRTPIPVSPLKGMYFFPTHSPKKRNNIWIAAHQTARVLKSPRHEQTKQTQSMILFKCGKTLTLNISLHTLQTQFERTLECMYRIENT